MVGYEFINLDLFLFYSHEYEFPLGWCANDFTEDMGDQSLDKNKFLIVLARGIAL